MTENPKVFISYSWEDEEHNAWVRTLANRLISNGINAIIDQTDSHYVIIVCSPDYKKNLITESAVLDMKDISFQESYSLIATKESLFLLLEKALFRNHCQHI